MKTFIKLLFRLFARSIILYRDIKWYYKYKKIVGWNERHAEEIEEANKKPPLCDRVHEAIGYNRDCVDVILMKESVWLSAVPDNLRIGYYFYPDDLFVLYSNKFMGYNLQIVNDNSLVDDFQIKLKAPQYIIKGDVIEAVWASEGTPEICIKALKFNK